MNPNIFGLNNGVKAALNNVTAWLDLSSVYGFDNFTVEGMRYYQGGRIKFLAEDDTFLPRLSDLNTIDDTPPWPFGRNNTFGAGDPRAFNNVILGSISTLWFRVHNYFADTFAVRARRALLGHAIAGRPALTVCRVERAPRRRCATGGKPDVGRRAHLPGGAQADDGAPPAHCVQRVPADAPGLGHGPDPAVHGLQADDQP